MAIWKDLARYGLMAAPFAAAPFTGGASLALIGAGAGAGSAALDGGDLDEIALAAGLGAIPGMAGAGAGAPGAPPSPGAAARPGFWSGLASQAKDGLKHRDTYLTAAKALSGALASAEAHRPSMADLHALEYIAGGGASPGQFGFTRASSDRERDEARKRIKGRGFWSQFLDYGVAPGLAVYGSMQPPYAPEGR